MGGLNESSFRLAIACIKTHDFDLKIPVYTCKLAAEKVHALEQRVFESSLTCFVGFFDRLRASPQSASAAAEEARARVEVLGLDFD
jgi:hypothetical protein